MNTKPLLVAALGLFLLGSCHNHDAHDHEAEGHDHEAETAAHDHTDEIVLTPEKARAAGVETSVIQPGSFHQVIRTSGQIVAAQGEETFAVAPVAGVVSFRRKVTEGMSVAKGNPLLTLSSSNIAEGDPVTKARIAYETARREYERMKALLPDKIVSEKDFQQAEQAYENARVNYEALGGNLSSDGGELTPDGVTVAAPMAGYVKSLLVKEGDYVQVGQPLIGISSNRRLYLRADVSEKYYNQLPRITSANFSTPYDDKTYRLDELNGRLLSYGKSATDQSYYIPVTFEFDNQVNVAPGAFVEVYLLGATEEGVLTLPRTALTEEQGSHFIYLQVDDHGYKKQLVTVGGDDGERVQILSGLKAGDRVVTRGAYQVKLASASNAIPAHTHEH